MKPLKFNIESLWDEIHGEISSLDVEEDFRHSILEDFELAVLCFKEKNTLSVLNCLAVIVGKLQTQAILSRCHFSVIENLLIRIYRLQQILIRLPICTVGPTGPAGPMGATGATVPTGSLGRTTITTSSFPVSGFPILNKPLAKSNYFDSSTHTVIYSKSGKKRRII